MSDMSIPPASLARLRAAYQQFYELAAIISDAMGIPTEVQHQLVLERGVFVVGDEAEQHTNGIAEVASHG